MKNVKKLLSIVMVLTLVLSLGASAFAANVKVEQNPGHAYVAYQIFKGTNQDDAGVIGNLTWGDDINAKGFAGALVSAGYISVEPDAAENYDAQEVAKALSEITDTDDLSAIAKIALANRVGGGTELKDGQADLPIGYYVIVDTTDVTDDNAVQNEVILQVSGSVEVTFKAETPTSDKQVKDINDSVAGSETDWQDSADHDINDVINYRLHAHLPKDITTYSTYYLQFVDTMSQGLSYTAGSAKAYYTYKDAEGTEHTVNLGTLADPSSENYAGTEAEYEGGKVLTWTFDDLLKYTGVTASQLNGADFYIEYTAELNENAVIGEKGNPNKMHIVFSNTPDGTGHGKNDDDKVTVFTFKMDVTKVDQDTKPLAGAGFTLYKYDPDVEGEDRYVAVGEEVEVALVGEDYVASFEGLDDGLYRLRETTTPDGYNTIPDVYFTVTAEHEKEDADPQLSDLDVEVTAPEDFNITATLSGGSLSTTITNQKGVELPETGGIGTTIFYIVGAVLVAGAVILLVTKKRVSGAEK